VKGVSFTGGTATGIQIRKDTASDIYKHLSLELGGKNPTLIFDDVDMEKAVATAAMAAFENQGEVSLSNAICGAWKLKSSVDVTDLSMRIKDICSVENLRGFCKAIHSIRRREL
jgi:hypothetical protein